MMVCVMMSGHAKLLSFPSPCHRLCVKHKITLYMFVSFFYFLEFYMCFVPTKTIKLHLTENAFAFVYREVCKSICLSNSPTLKRKAGETSMPYHICIIFVFCVLFLYLFCDFNLNHIGHSIFLLIEWLFEHYGFSLFLMSLFMWSFQGKNCSKFQDNIFVLSDVSYSDL